MRSSPFTGRYLFHLHTTYTDGKASVQQYFAMARRMQVERLIFLEHIRAQPGYDVRQFTAEVADCAAAYGVPALVGFEAKLLPGGGLDISGEHAAQAEVLGLAEHGFPGDYVLWHTSISKALELCASRYSDKPVVWVHPGLWLKRNGLLAAHEGEYRALIAGALAAGIKVEWNLRYGLLPRHLHDAVPADELVCGVDAHSLADAEAAASAL